MIIGLLITLFWLLSGFFLWTLVFICDSGCLTTSDLVFCIVMSWIGPITLLAGLFIVLPNGQSYFRTKIFKMKNKIIIKLP